MSPRLQSTSSVKVSVTDWPAVATARSPSAVTIRATVVLLPEGEMRTASPGRTWPPAIWPAKPRKSRSGRFTHCTGIRKGPAARRSSSTCTVSRCGISAGPVYQGVASLNAVMLSPFNADIGMARKSVSPICAANWL